MPSRRFLKGRIRYGKKIDTPEARARIEDLLKSLDKESGRYSAFAVAKLAWPELKAPAKNNVDLVKFVASTLGIKFTGQNVREKDDRS